MKKLMSVVLWFLPLSVLAQSPFDGTWKTDTSASKFSPKPIVFSVNSGMYDCSSCVPRISIKADGQDQNVAAPARDYDTLAVEVKDANTIHATAKKGGKQVFDQTRTVSSDGKTLTVTSSNFPADGSQAYKSEAQLTRVAKGPAGSNGTSGSWRINSVNEDAAGLMTTYKGAGDQLTMTTPTGESWEAKFDGKDYPVKGTFANETVSLKNMGDHGMEATYKRDGKVYSVEKATISADGNKMTTVVDNKLTGRTSTFVSTKQ